MEYTDNYGNRVNIDINTEIGVFPYGVVIKGAASYMVSVGHCLKVVDIKFECTYDRSTRDLELTPSFCTHPVDLSGFTAPYAMDAITDCLKDASAAYKRLLDKDAQDKLKKGILIPLSHVRFENGSNRYDLGQTIKSHVAEILFSAVESE